MLLFTCPRCSAKKEGNNDERWETVLNEEYTDETYGLGILEVLLKGNMYTLDNCAIKREVELTFVCLFLMYFGLAMGVY